jgi:hypothetical protein
MIQSVLPEPSSSVSTPRISILSGPSLPHFAQGYIPVVGARSSNSSLRNALPQWTHIWTWIKGSWGLPRSMGTVSVLSLLCMVGRSVSSERIRAFRFYSAYGHLIPRTFARRFCEYLSLMKGSQIHASGCASPHSNLHINLMHIGTDRFRYFESLLLRVPSESEGSHIRVFSRKQREQLWGNSKAK